MTAVVLQAAPCAPAPLGLPLKKRKSTIGKDREPSKVLLCENGLAVCKTLGIRSAHIKRSSNAPHVAVTVIHPDTNKRVSVALWKIVTARVEPGWSVQYLNDNATDLRIENLKTISPTERDEQAEADAKHISEFNAALRALPLSPAQQAKVERQHRVFDALTSDEQNAFYKYLCGTARNRLGGDSNFALTEDVVSEIFAFNVWPRIVATLQNLHPHTRLP